MKKHDKLFRSASLILATVALFASFAGCKSGKESSDSPSGNVTAQKPVSDALDRGELTNTLHKVNITPSNRTFAYVSGGKTVTDYKILVNAASSYALRAANFISQQLSSATDADFTVETHTEGDGKKIETASKYIVVGCRDLFSECGLKMPEENLGPAGYYIKSYGDSVFMEVKQNDGYQMGTIAFLKAVVGYDMIAHDTVAFENKGETLPDLEIIEKPDFDYRNYTNWMTETGRYGMGYGMTHIFTLVGEKKVGVHNIFEYLPTEKYLKEHPEWYSGNATYRQLCYTAHGDAEEYDLMQEAMLDVMMKYILEQPDQGVITVTQEDWAYCCECDECRRVVEKDGSISATIIRYMNDLDDKLNVRLEEYAQQTGTEKREMQIAFFAYHTSYSPPTTPVSEDPTLKCNPDITVFIAPIDAKYGYSFYDDENRVYAEMVKKWSEYTDNLMAWVYETNYHHYMFPYNTYSSMMDTYYFFKQNGANIIYNEGQRWSENVTCFGKLKEYLDSKAQIDVTVSYEYYKDKFFRHYYGDAADTMEQYYNELRQWVIYLESVSDYGLGGGIYEEIGADKRFWPKEMLEGWLKLMDQAYKEISHLEIENPSEYEKLVKHIKIEELFPRFALCTLHEASYTSSEIKEMRSEFKKDADKLGLVEYCERGYFSDMYKMWGLI